LSEPIVFPLPAHGASQIRAIRPSLAFRHLFADGGTTAKFELAFSLSKHDAAKLTFDTLVALIAHILERTVVVGRNPFAVSTTLMNAGKELAQHYLRATTSRPPVNPFLRLLRPSAIKTGFGEAVDAGAPLVTVIDVVNSEAWTSRGTPVPNLGKMHLNTWAQTIGRRSIDCILLTEHGRRNTELAINLRHYINRIHAELTSTEQLLLTTEQLLAKAANRRELGAVNRCVDVLEDTKVRRIYPLIGRIGKSVIALSESSGSDAIQVGSELLHAIWPSRTGGVIERLARTRNKLEKREQQAYRRSLFGWGKTSQPRGPIFISYRKADARDLAGRIRDRLVYFEPRYNVFRDDDSIVPGANWRTVIKSGIDEAKLVLLIMSENWLGDGPSGKRRIDSLNDMVRYEVETALSLERTLIPLVVLGTIFPPPALPSSLSPLAGIQTFNFDPREFDSSIATLRKAIAWHLGRR
jgi:hypothetical protein